MILACSVGRIYCHVMSSSERKNASIKVFNSFIVKASIGFRRQWLAAPGVGQLHVVRRFAPTAMQHGHLGPQAEAH
jgi:hypothetical protein